MCYVQAAAALQADRMRRALEARAVVAQVAEQKEAGRAAMAATQVSLMERVRHTSIVRDDLLQLCFLSSKLWGLA